MEFDPSVSDYATTLSLFDDLDAPEGSCQEDRLQPLEDQKVQTSLQRFFLDRRIDQNGAACLSQDKVSSKYSTNAQEMTQKATQLLGNKLAPQEPTASSRLETSPTYPTPPFGPLPTGVPENSVPLIFQVPDGASYDDIYVLLSDNSTFHEIDVTTRGLKEDVAWPNGGQSSASQYCVKLSDLMKTGEENPILYVPPGDARLIYFSLGGPLGWAHPTLTNPSDKQDQEIPFTIMEYSIDSQGSQPPNLVYHINLDITAVNFFSSPCLSAQLFANKEPYTPPGKKGPDPMGITELPEDFIGNVKQNVNNYTANSPTAQKVWDQIFVPIGQLKENNQRILAPKNLDGLLSAGVPADKGPFGSYFKPYIDEVFLPYLSTHGVYLHINGTYLTVAYDRHSTTGFIVEIYQSFNEPIQPAIRRGVLYLPTDTLNKNNYDAWLAGGVESVGSISSFAQKMLTRVEGLSESGCSLTEIQAWEYAALKGLISDPSYMSWFNCFSTSDQSVFNTLSGLDAFNQQLSSHSISPADVKKITYDFSQGTVVLQNASDAAFMADFYASLKSYPNPTPQDLITAVKAAYGEVPYLELSTPMKTFIVGLTGYTPSGFYSPETDLYIKEESQDIANSFTPPKTIQDLEDNLQAWQRANPCTLDGTDEAVFAQAMSALLMSGMDLSKLTTSAANPLSNYGTTFRQFGVPFYEATYQDKTSGEEMPMYDLYERAMHEAGYSAYAYDYDELFDGANDQQVPLKTDGEYTSGVSVVFNYDPLNS